MSVAQAPASQLKDEISTRIDALRPELERIGRDIHANPETAYEERQAVGWLTALLREHGFDVEVGVANTPTAFVATRRKGSGPSIAFLSEYDALRGLGHGCGHNLIATASAGAGIALAEALDRVPGRVQVIGTPAEEGGGGKIRLIRAGIFQEVDAAMMFHPDSRTQVLHWALAVTHMHFEFIGRAAHASGDPEQGINALDAFVLAYNGISMLRQHIKEGARLHGFLKEGGTAPNIVPERTSGEFLVRARDTAYMQELVQKVKNIFQAAALATGCSVKLTFDEEPYSDLRNNAVLAALFEENLRRLGIDPVEPVPWANAGSTDMGNVTHVVPGLHPTLAIAPADVPTHSQAFLEASGSLRGYQAMIDAAKALAMTGADLLTDPSLVEKAKAEFRQT
ncbi:MAG TPA: M20 family metallopeptidase [Candidatus Dormibacteraeota bacterium]|jgi:amidohydrolase|nr:M20 family metallopeptidase [Candidatus Dormibacteraeota bacterium]